MNALRPRSFSSTTRVVIVASTLAVLALGGVGVRYGLPAWRDWRSRSLETQCRRLRDRREWQRLHQVAETWVRNDPGRAAPLLYLAEAEAGQRQYLQAAELLFRIPQTDPKAIPAYLQGATLLLSQANRPLEGVQALERLLAIEPKVADAHKHLIHFSALALQRKELHKHIRFAIDSDREPPEAYVYLLLADTLRLSNGVEMNERWLEAYPDNELFQVARALHMEDVRIKAEALDAGKPAETEKETGSSSTSVRSRLLAELLTRFPHNVELLSYHIEQALLVGDTDRVVELLAQAPAEIDEDNRFWRYKGQIHEIRKEVPEAEAAYRRALELNRLDWSTMIKLTAFERMRGRFPEVERLQGLVTQAEILRTQVRKYPSAELVEIGWLRKLQGFAREAGDNYLTQALEHRLAEVETSNR